MLLETVSSTDAFLINLIGLRCTFRRSATDISKEKIFSFPYNLFVIFNVQLAIYNWQQRLRISEFQN